MLTRTLFIAAFFALHAGPAHAQFNPSAILNALANQLNTPVAQKAISALVTITAMSADNRAYQPASPLGTSVGVDLGLEITAMHIPANLLADISAAVGSTSLSGLPALPVPRLSLHKGLGKLDVGGTYLGFLPAPYNLYSILGLDAQLTIIEPEEGLRWAVRMNYTYASFDMIKTTTWTPQILASVPLSFAEPYAGIGYQIASATLSGTLTQSVAGVTVSVPLSTTGRASALQGFLGTAFKFGPSGVKLTVEMAYNSSGMDHLGTKLSLCF